MSTSAVARRARAAGLAVSGGAPVTSSMVPLVSVSFTQGDIDAAVAVLKSGNAAQGKNCLELERRFAAASDAKRAMTCANGTCALQLAYEPLIQPGDEVLVPAWTYIATVSMVVARGGVPIFCDADPRTYSIDVADAARKVTTRTTAIAATHLYGNPVDISAVEALAADKGLSVVFDAAQAHLATYKGQGIGAFGDAVTYSFYATKNMTTGEGGLVTTNDDELDRRMRLLRSHGETAKYTHGVIGYNYRMTDVEAALGLSQFERLAEATEKRQANAETLDRAIAQIAGLAAPTTTPGATNAYHLYPVRVDPDAFVTTGGADATDGSLRDEFCKALNAEGVATAIHYPRSLTRQPVFDRAGMRHMPVADRLASTLFCVPIHNNLTELQLRQIGEALHKVAEALRA